MWESSPARSARWIASARAPAAALAESAAVRRRLVGGAAADPEELRQLAVHVEPFPDADIVEELGPARTSEGARTELVLLRAEVVPEVQERQEVARGIREAGVRLGRLLAPVLGPLAHVLDREPRDDREDVGKHPGALRFEQHPGEARVDRKPRDAAAERCEGRSRTDRPELDEQVERRLDPARVGRGEEGERRNVAEAQGEHLEDDRGEPRAQDLRLRERGTRREVVLGIEADRDARGGASRPARALLRRGL